MRTCTNSRGGEYKLGFGKYLSSLRESKGLSLRKLSELTGISPSNISTVENGKSRVKRDFVTKCALALGVEKDSLLLSAGYIPDSGNFDLFAIEKFLGGKQVSLEQSTLYSSIVKFLNSIERGNVTKEINDALSSSERLDLEVVRHLLNIQLSVEMLRRIKLEYLHYNRANVKNKCSYKRKLCQDVET